MAKKLDDKIIDFLKMTSPVIEKSYNFVTNKDNDWTTLEKLKDRSAKHAIEVLAVNSAISVGEDLFNIASDVLNHPRIEEMMDKLNEIFTIHQSRYTIYTQDSDWNTMDEGENTGSEIKFQVECLDKLKHAKDKLSKFNFGKPSKDLDFATHNDTPIPLVMCEKTLSKFPEIIEYLKMNEKAHIFEDLINKIENED